MRIEDLKNCIRVGALLLLLAPATLWADTIEGYMTGLKCASKGEVCPTDREDPHVLMEPDFVVLREDGSYLFITNMDWRTKLKFVLERVRVKGTLSQMGSAITADEFWVKRDDTYHLGWSLERARKKLNARQDVWPVPSNDR